MVIRDISVLQSPMVRRLAAGVVTHRTPPLLTRAVSQWTFLVTDSQNVAFDKIYLYANSTNPSILAKNTESAFRSKRSSTSKLILVRLRAQWMGHIQK